MGRYIIKAEKDVDFYIEWSTVIDNWVSAGTRQEMLDEGIAEGRLERADRLGSSYMLSSGRWDDEELMVANLPDGVEYVYEGYYTLPRKNLIRFVNATDETKLIDPEEVREMLVLNELD